MSRNHINVLSSTVLVALPGGEGTASEARLALTYKKPIVAFLDLRFDIPNLPESILWTKDFMEVQRFVEQNIKQ